MRNKQLPKPTGERPLDYIVCKRFRESRSGSHVTPILLCAFARTMQTLHPGCYFLKLQLKPALNLTSEDAHLQRVSSEISNSARCGFLMTMDIPISLWFPRPWNCPSSFRLLTSKWSSAMVCRQSGLQPQKLRVQSWESSGFSSCTLTSKRTVTCSRCGHSLRRDQCRLLESVRLIILRFGASSCPAQQAAQ